MVFPVRVNFGDKGGKRAVLPYGDGFERVPEFLFEADACRVALNFNGALPHKSALRRLYHRRRVDPRVELLRRQDVQRNACLF